MRIAQEEIFGPVQVLIPFDTEEQAIQIANGQGLEPILKYAQLLGSIPASAAKRVKVGKNIRRKFSKEGL